MALVTVGLNAVTARQSAFKGLLLMPRPILLAYARSWMAADVTGALPLVYLTGAGWLGGRVGAFMLRKQP